MTGKNLGKNISEPRIIVALDFDEESQVIDFVEKLDPSLCRLKIGKELFTACGPAIVERLASQGYDIFLDLKFHDIPNTVAQALRSAASLGIWMANVHASGGRRMLETAVQAMQTCERSPILIAVTVLTSMTETELVETGINQPAEQQVLDLAALSKDCGLQGVVCSAHEAALIRSKIESPFVLVTPGIRLTGGDTDDQHRIMTPDLAVRAGSDYLVIGRPITRNKHPLKIINQIIKLIG